ncbi:MAG: biotin--[acetyl-CoA-carboxylase] ligase [Acetobacteraceae bacterium]|nr:biotin--[acetyl-CoA-carboxylase] ligase [Acetobacteraceae bacterium]
MFDIRLYDSLGSTNDEARRLAEGGAAHGTVVAAREQTAGRGRAGRSWASPPENLYLSVLLRLDRTPGRLAELSFVAALAVADMVDAFLPTGVRATLKWPNDVLVGGAKISGILLEQADGATIIGMGVNVVHAPAGTPYPATSLAREAGEASAVSVEACRTALLAALAKRLDAWLGAGFVPVRAAWLARAHPLGTPLRAGQTDGAFAGLDADGALLLDTSDGRCRVVAGEVFPSPGDGRASGHRA